ncbi:MAG: VCBS repeat-containing protein [Myxococcota bacterium]|nr:VCBS repeat-containing protein [Myxococcota bacterium]
MTTRRGSDASLGGVSGTLLLALLLACGGEEKSAPAPAPAPSPRPAAPPAPPPAPEPAALPDADAYPQGIALALAQFVQKEGKPVPGAARVEFVYRQDGAWKTASLEDPESNVFHKAMLYEGTEGQRLLTMGGTAAIVKTWAPNGQGGLDARNEWQKDFGGKFSRMRDAEVGDIYGDGAATVAVATHDQGVVAVLKPRAGGFDVEELDLEKDTFVHEIEIGDLDGDGALEIYATPSEPNKLDGSPQTGQVVRYVPGKGEGRTVVADLGLRHAKEILVEDVDGDGRDELYVAVEGHVEDKQLIEPVEIRRYDADTPADQGVVIGDLNDRLCRFLTAGDIDGDGKKELVAAAFKKGVWLLRPGSRPKGLWDAELIDHDSGGFEHASILTDLDGDGRDELYVASDDDKELRRYRWNGQELVRDTIYRRPDARPIFTWNLMPVPVDLIPRR